MSTLLWVVVPYAALLTFVLGTIWRYRYDKFGWTTRSSQLYGGSALNWASPLFHGGVLLVLAGHIGGLLVPKSWTAAIGIDDHTYHLAAVYLGTVAGLSTVVGLAVLVARRRLVGPVFAATTRNDKAMYVVLGAVLLLGLVATIGANLSGDGYDYRATVSPWLRSVLTFRPRAGLMSAVPLGFQAHVLAAFALLAFWPFTRLVHAFSAPLGYLTRPYVVYRSRDVAGLRAPRRGWDQTPANR